MTEFEVFNRAVLSGYFYFCAAQILQVEIVEKPLNASAAVLFCVINDLSVEQNLEQAIYDFKFFLRNFHCESERLALRFLGGAGKKARKFFGNPHGKTLSSKNLKQMLQQKHKNI